MIRKPWQIWLLFGSCLAIVVPAMVWLTLNALQLDEQIRLSGEKLQVEQQNAALYEQVSNSLRLMDWRLTPLVAEEAIRPFYDYLSFRPSLNISIAKAEGKGSPSLPDQTVSPVAEVGKQQLPSPLLMQPSSFVKLHFQVTAGDHWSSPQVPPPDLQKLAQLYGVTDQLLVLRTRLLAEISETTRFQQLLTMVPEAMLPKYATTQAAGKNHVGYAYGGEALGSGEPGQIFDLGLENLKQQVDRSASSLPAGQGRADQGTTQNGQVLSGRDNDVDQSNAFDLAKNQNQVGQTEQQRRQRIEQSRLQLWNQRNIGIQSFAMSQMVQKRGAPPSGVSSEPVTEGVTRPVWIGSHLILVRRVVHGSEVVVQGCWLDWEKLRGVLLADISGFLRRAQLAPVNEDREVYPERMLATLPLELVVDPAEAKELAVHLGQNDADVQVAPSSAIRVSLVIAWCCMIGATVSIASVLQGVVTLSERRGAFVSTVTHELRTPLTTFQMYSEMLSTGMIQDEEKKSHYLETLRVEADRLAHLLENVLQYARLERGKQGKQRQLIEARELWKRVESRLVDRAGQAGMQINVELHGELHGARVWTDPSAVEQILFNLVDNACKYAGESPSKRIDMQWQIDNQSLRIQVADDGPGIPTENARHLFRPFSKSVHDAANTAPGVGLGLALCRQLSRALGGQLEYDGESGSGATFVLTIPLGKS